MWQKTCHKNKTVDTKHKRVIRLLAWMKTEIKSNNKTWWYILMSFFSLSSTNQNCCQMFSHKFHFYSCLLPPHVCTLFAWYTSRKPIWFDRIFTFPYALHPIIIIKKMQRWKNEYENKNCMEQMSWKRNTVADGDKFFYYYYYFCVCIYWREIDGKNTNDTLRDDVENGKKNVRCGLKGIHWKSRLVNAIMQFGMWIKAKEKYWPWMDLQTVHCTHQIWPSCMYAWENDCASIHETSTCHTFIIDLSLLCTITKTRTSTTKPDGMEWDGMTGRKNKQLYACAFVVGDI